MTSNLEDIWEDVLNIIKEDLSEVSFNTWLKTIEPISISSDKIILGAPNDFTRGILQGRYLNLIKNIEIKKVLFFKNILGVVFVLSH